MRPSSASRVSVVSSPRYTYLGNMTMSMMTKLYKLPEKHQADGMRPMQSEDVPQVTKLLQYGDRGTGSCSPVSCFVSYDVRNNASFFRQGQTTSTKSRGTSISMYRVVLFSQE